MLAGAGTIWGVSSIFLTIAGTTTGATIAGATTSATTGAGVPLTTSSAVAG